MNSRVNAWQRLVLASVLAVAGISGGFWVAQPAQASPLSLASVADSYVLSTSGASNFGTALAIKESASTYRGLVKFDTSSIPVGSTINSVALKLYSTFTSSSGGIKVHSALDSWTESAVTWGTQPTWNNTVLATSSTPLANTWLSISLPSTSVTAGTKTNYGFDFSPSGIVDSVASRETANGPQLLVDYTAPTSSAPTVTTGAATSVTTAAAAVTGSANDNGAATTCHFDYGTSVSYNGVTSDQSMAADASTTSLSASLVGLTASTLYNYRLSCTNSFGTTFGSNATFTTTAAAGSPTATTGASSNVTASTATLAGSANANGTDATCRFDDGSSSSYGSQTAAQTVAATAGSVNLSATISGLTPSTGYNYRLECTNSVGITLGSNNTFTTKAATAVTTVTLTPSQDTYISSSSTAANFGTATPIRMSASAYRGLLAFDTTAIPAGSTISAVSLKLYSPTALPSGGLQIRPERPTWGETTVTWANQPAWSFTVLSTTTTPATNAWLTIALPITAVTPGTVASWGLSYSVSGIIANIASREDATNSPQLSVSYTTSSTSPAPTVTTGTASAVTTTGATLSATVNDNGTDTTCRLDYGATTSYGSQTAIQNIAAGSGATSVSAALTGLIAGTPYDYRIECANAGGTTLGSNVTFTTITAVPSVSTGLAVNVNATTATLSGTVGSDGAATACRFDYGTTTVYGTQTAIQNFPASVNTMTVLANLSGLTASTLYNFLLECTNVNGTVVGTNATFRSLATSVTHNVTKVLTIVEENDSYTNMMTKMPYLDGLAAKYGYSNNYRALTHPSLPNYLGLAAGSTFGVTTDCSVSTCPQTGPTVFDQAIAAGKSAKVYAEDMTTNCLTSGSGAGLYAARHTAWPYFTNATSRSNCSRFQVPSGTYASGNFKTDVGNGALPNVGWLIPNLCNDAHNHTATTCNLATADAWLQNMLPVVMTGADYLSGHLAIVVIADENDGSPGNQVVDIVIHPDLNAKIATVALNHYSLTKFQEQVAGVTTYLNNAAGATDMGPAFGLTVGP